MMKTLPLEDAQNLENELVKSGWTQDIQQENKVITEYMIKGVELMVELLNMQAQTAMGTIRLLHEISCRNKCRSKCRNKQGTANG